MSSHDNEGTKVTADDPVVSATSTVAKGDGWLTSGTVSLTVRREGTVLADLQFPFVDARSEQEAIQQGLGQLKIVLHALSALSKRLEGR